MVYSLKITTSSFDCAGMDACYQQYLPTMRDTTNLGKQVQIIVAMRLRYGARVLGEPRCRLTRWVWYQDGVPRQAYNLSRHLIKKLPPATLDTINLVGT
jgi:hypothetical protein